MISGAREHLLLRAGTTVEPPEPEPEPEPEGDQGEDEDGGEE